MERKNKKLIVIVSCLLLVISVSLAYYIGSLLISGEGATGNATTAKIKGATIKVEGVLEFNDPDILPGHKTISSIKVTATGNNELIPYNLIWKGESGISKINYTVYKTSSEMNVSANCEKKTSVQNGVQILNEECSINNMDNLGTSIASGSIDKNSTKEILAKDEFITATNDGDTKYYYVILEYPNLDEDQSADINATFNGEVTVEESNTSPDINILAVYIKQEDGEYKQEEDIPQSGYALNTSKSTCTNNAIPTWDYDKKGLLTTNLTKNGTSCYLYFDKTPNTIDEMIGLLKAKTEIPDFKVASTIDEGIYAVSDGMYGGTSYYWRGAATTNYVKFGGYCWRIVRINGDKTMRLIYDGTTCHANGELTEDSIVVKQSYSSDPRTSEAMGWRYTSGRQRPTSTSSGTSSKAKTSVESWYNTNIGNNATYSSKVADGKYCNDRNVSSGYVWASAPAENFYYAADKRLYTDYMPTLSCEILDTYTLKVGLITADEVMYAGGNFTNNTSYYLYNGRNYYTMTPDYWRAEPTGGSASSPDLYSRIYIMSGNGKLTSSGLSSVLGIRPVINLHSGIKISSGNGTIEYPYIVAD